MKSSATGFVGDQQSRFVLTVFQSSAGIFTVRGSSNVIKDSADDIVSLYLQYIRFEKEPSHEISKRARKEVGDEIQERS
jgi:hypothetical protein